MGTALLTIGALLIGAPALAGEPLELGDEQMDQVTAGACDVTCGQIVVFAPERARSKAFEADGGVINIFVHPTKGVDHETFVIPGQGANVTTPSGSHGSLPPPD
jgi:hypothetical protein